MWDITTAKKKIVGSAPSWLLPAPPVPHNPGDYMTTKTSWQDLLKTARHTHRKITDEGLIIWTIAYRRTGKTYQDVADGLASMRRGEINAFNYDLILPPDIRTKYYIRYEKIVDVCYREGIRIHIDEGAVDFDCREWANTPPAIRTWISHIGKLRQCVRLISQVSGQLDKSFKDQCDVIYTMNKYFGRVLHLTQWNRDRFKQNPNMEALWETENILDNLLTPDRWYFMQKNVYAAFNTYNLFFGSNYNDMTKKEKQEEFKVGWEKAKKERESKRKEEFELLLNPIL